MIAMRTRFLLSAHALSGLVAILLGPLVAHTRWADIVFIGLVTSQLCLLGMWAGFSRCRRYLRLAWTVGGTAAIWAVIAFASRSHWLGPTHDFRDFQGFVLIPGILATFVVLTMALICFALRRWWVQLGRLEYDLSNEYDEGLKFSLGQLLALPCFYAVVMAIGRAVVAPGTQTIWVWIPAGVFFALSIATVPIAATWAALGKKQPLMRTGLALIFVGVNGLLPPTVLGGQWWHAINWMLIYLATCILIVLSLLLVRSNGYRVTYSAVHHHEAL